MQVDSAYNAAVFTALGAADPTAGPAAPPPLRPHGVARWRGYVLFTC